MKRIVSFTLCIIFIILDTFFVFAAPSGSNETNDAEILRSVAYGFVPEGMQGDWDNMESWPCGGAGCSA